jgi:pyrroline-5-carboxylate reductase
VTIKLSTIGGGVMAEAIVSRLLASGKYAASEILVSEPTVARRELLQQQYGIEVTADNRQAAAAPIVILAVKPQIFDRIVPDFAGVTIDRLIISILAGVSLARLAAAFPQQAVVRAMPNTPATVGAGITALAMGSEVTPSGRLSAIEIFQAVGETIEVTDALMDAVTGLSGSGPAYVAIAIEALADGGVAAGLPRPIADRLALQTVLGTARLLAESDLHPAQLKDRVTSPGGTTIAGVAALEAAGFRSALITAVQAAATRSQALG